MLYSQGVRLEDLGIPTRDGTPVESDPRAIWRRFAAHYHLFRGTPSRMWLDWVFAEVFGLDVRARCRDRRPLFRHDRRRAEDRRVPPARAVRAVRDRGHRHHRKPARPARASPRDPRQRLAGPRRHRLSPRSGDGSRGRGLRRQRRAVRRDQRRGRRQLRRLPARAREPAGVLPRVRRDLDRPRPPPTRPPPGSSGRRSRRFTPRRSPASARPPRPTCSAATCWSRWRG